MKKDKLNLIAHTIDGINLKLEIEVKMVNVWIGRECSHPVSERSIEALLREVERSGSMQIYYCPGDALHGHIDAFSGTPLYTNGQRTVESLELDGVNIWNNKYGKALCVAKTNIDGSFPELKDFNTQFS